MIMTLPFFSRLFAVFIVWTGAVGCTIHDQSNTHSFKKVDAVLSNSEQLHGQLIAVAGVLVNAELGLLCSAPVERVSEIGPRDCISLWFDAAADATETPEASYLSLSGRWVLVSGDYQHEACFNASRLCIVHTTVARSTKQKSVYGDDFVVSTDRLVTVSSIRALTRSERRALTRAGR